MSSRVKQRVTGNKRTIDEAECDSEPRRKKQRLDESIKGEEISDHKWICKQCTLENEASSTKCIICNIPKNYTFKDDQWGDDIELDIQPKTIYSSTDTTNSNKASSTQHKQKESTLNGLVYTECWLCTQCHAMNNLKLTFIKYSMRCSYCKAATYTPRTEIIKSFEWDQSRHEQEELKQERDQYRVQVTQKELMAEFETKKRLKYSTKGMNNREGDVLITGMINQNKVRRLATIDLIPEEVIRLTLLFAGTFEHDGWDTLTNQLDFELDKHLVVIYRSLRSDGQWRNCFGMRQCKLSKRDTPENIRFEWKLKCNKRRNKDWEEEPVESVIIGVIDAEGIKGNMGSAFTAYNDGFGVCGDGTKVTGGEYKPFNHGFSHSQVISVALQWNTNHKCQLIYDGRLAFEVDPDKVYKLAVAINSREYEVEWIEFMKSNEMIELKTPK